MCVREGGGECVCVRERGGGGRVSVCVMSRGKCLRPLFINFQVADVILRRNKGPWPTERQML